MTMSAKIGFVIYGAFLCQISTVMGQSPEWRILFLVGAFVGCLERPNDTTWFTKAVMAGALTLVGWVAHQYMVAIDPGAGHQISILVFLAALLLLTTYWRTMNLVVRQLLPTLWGDISPQLRVNKFGVIIALYEMSFRSEFVKRLLDAYFIWFFRDFPWNRWKPVEWYSMWGWRKPLP